VIWAIRDATSTLVAVLSSNRATSAVPTATRMPAIPRPVVF